MLTFQIASDLDHEEVIAEINLGDSFLCLLSKENTDETVMIELPVELPTSSSESFKRIRLDEFIRTIDLAKLELINPK